MNTSDLMWNGGPIFNHPRLHCTETALHMDLSLRALSPTPDTIKDNERKNDGLHSFDGAPPSVVSSLLDYGFHLNPKSSKRNNEKLICTWIDGVWVELLPLFG